MKRRKYIDENANFDIFADIGFYVGSWCYIVDESY